MNTDPRSWTFPGATSLPTCRPWLMGIVNVTPDSFSDGGRYLQATAAVEHATLLEHQGADILDVGGESTRPGAAPVPEDEEIRRVVPVVSTLAGRVRCPISIDTYKASVARQALQAGAQIVNDISGLTLDPEMIPVCAATEAGIIVMHMQGTPQTMQHNPCYVSVVDDILSFFEERLRTLEAAGIDPARIVFDPGIGFGKTARHNLEILQNIPRLQSLGRPILIGHSRKRFLKRVLGETLDEYSAGTLGVSLALVGQGVDLLRVHDVSATRDALLAWQTVTGRRPLPDSDHSSSST